MIGWNADISIGEFLFDAVVILVLFAVGYLLQSRSRLLQRYLIPVSLIAGFIGFSVGPAALDVVQFQIDNMSFYVYHLLALTFIVVGLRTPRSRAGIDAFHVGFVKTVSLIIQALTGLAVLYFFFQFVDSSVSPAVGMLLPLGFGMGPGVALSVGASWEALGVPGAADAGLAIATAGFVVAYVVGVWTVNKGVRDGLVSALPIAGSDSESPVAQESVQSPRRGSGLSSVLLSVAVVSVCSVAVYFITYAFMKVASAGMRNVGLSAEVSILWSLNFLWANIIAMAFRKLVGRNRSASSALDHPVLDKTVSVLADLLIATAVMAIGLTLTRAYFLPLMLACVFGAIITYFVVRETARWAFKDHAFTRFVGLFGEQMGTVSSGLALIRMVDEGYQTPVARDQVLGSGTALVLGFPLLLLINLPLTRFGGSATGYSIVAALLVAYLACTILAWRIVHRRFK